MGPCQKLDVSGVASIYARYSKYMQEKTGFGMRNCLWLHSLWWMFCNDENTIGKADERTDSYTEQYTGCFNCHSIKVGKMELSTKLFNRL